MMSEFLVGRELDAAIARILVEPGCRAAVAFWGRESEKRLPLSGKGEFQVICNLMSGGTNPHAIEKLKRANVRRSDTLHAKVFLGKTDAVVASANVSANGLGLEGGEQARWIEAGILTTEIGPITSWMEKLWKESQPIKDEDIEVAKSVWAQRQRARPASKSILDFSFGHNDFPLVYWHGENEDWEPNIEAIRKQKITKKDVDEGLEAWGDYDLEVMSPGRWVLVWQRRKDGMPAKTPRPYWFQCGSALMSTFRYAAKKNWYHTVQAYRLSTPKPFDINSSKFYLSFASTIALPKFQMLRTGDDDEPWLSPERVAMMREFWKALQQDLRKQAD